MDKKIKDVPPGLFDLVKRHRRSKMTLIIFVVCGFSVILGLFATRYMKEIGETRFSVPEKKEEISGEKVIRVEPEVRVVEKPPLAEKKEGPQIKKPEEKTVTKLLAKREISKPMLQTEKKVSEQISPTGKRSEDVHHSPPSDTGVDYLFRAHYYESKGMIREAIAEYREYLKHIKKEDPKILNKLTALCLMDQDLKGATYFSELAVKNAPSDPGVLLNYGVLKARIGENDTAEEIFKKVLNIDPGNINAMYNLAIIKEKKGEISEAEKIYSTLKDLGDKAAEEALYRIKSQR
ncbi:MAG: tetratricopeptide repeat protein [Deltaproteobacteria bacterium]|nr:tetratricopeptide repeat protein [Deltaproteobacteria bacterium]